MIRSTSRFYLCLLIQLCLRQRGNYIAAAAALVARVSFTITVASANHKVKYAFLCFGVGAIYAACPLTLLASTSFVAL